MKPILPILLLSAATAALAETPRQTADAYAAQARQADPAFAPSASRGAAFFAKRFGVSAKLPACTTCHTDDPAQPGRHAVTGKAIKPLAARANAERFTDPAKTEKWLRRNCTEVVGRECSVAEKADLLRFFTEGA
jgi:Domain of unknown function (DUF1924)